jgi:transposase
MEVLHARCAGLDVHKNNVVACLRTIEGGKVRRETRTFATTTSALFDLLAWLSDNEVSVVAMEATGVYWKPVWNILSGASFQLLLGDARRMRNVPGRKSDTSDAQWIAELTAHGLVEPCFVPERPIQELRDLTRTRKQLVREQADAVNRIHKVLEGANIKLGSVVSDIVGVSGRTILEAVIRGETDPRALAALASERLKASRETLSEALRGKVTSHHRFLLDLHLKQVDHLRAMVAHVDARIEELGRPFHDAVVRLEQMPGVSRTAAFTIVAEVGADMSRFDTPQHLVSFAGLCPRMDSSAGKTKSTRTRRGSNWLKTVIVSCAWAAARAKNTYYRAQFQRLKARRGPTKAVVAVAASLITGVYFVLNGAAYRELGDTHFDRLNRERIAHRLRKRLESLGYSVALSPAA